MNSISNIEIINFEDLNDKNQSIDLEHEKSLNCMNNCIIEKYYSEYSENQYENITDFPCNISFCSESNNIFQVKKINLNESNVNLSCAEYTTYSENLKNSSLNDSFNNLEKITNNSFSFIQTSNKFNLSCKKGSNFFKTSSNGKVIKNFPCTENNCDKVYKSKENLILHYKNIHLKEKPYSCIYCASRFSHRNGKTKTN